MDTPSSETPHVDIRVPLTNTEKQFLLVAVEAAVKKFREMQAMPSRLVQTPSLGNGRQSNAGMGPGIQRRDENEP